MKISIFVILFDFLKYLFIRMFSNSYLIQADFI